MDRLVPLFIGDPGKLTEPERERLGLHRLPAMIEGGLLIAQTAYAERAPKEC